MKNVWTLVLILSASIAIAQHKGNYNQITDISRQNITQSRSSGNAIIYNPHQNTQQLRNLNPNVNIDIDLKALYNVKATSYTAVFNVSQIGETAEDANGKMKERIDSLKEKLRLAGIPQKDMVIDVISFIPVYEIEIEKKIFSKKYNEVPKGFELQQNIHVQFNDAHQFESILAACSKSEIYNLVKVDYFIENIREIYKKLQDQLLELVAEKKAYYKVLGFDLNTDYNPMVADDKYCYFPKDFYRSYQAYNSVSFEAIKKPKGVTKAKKQTSYYYQPLTYEQFDVVLEPSILEPVVQVGMSLKLLYSPKPKEKKKPAPQKTKTEHKYYVISPEGNIDIKELKTDN